MLFVSSTIRSRRSSNLEAAPKKVNASRSPNKAKTALSIVAMPATALSPCSARRRSPMRRPRPINTRMPANRPSVQRIPMMTRFIVQPEFQSETHCNTPSRERASEGVSSFDGLVLKGSPLRARNRPRPARSSLQLQIPGHCCLIRADTVLVILAYCGDDGIEQCLVIHRFSQIGGSRLHPSRACGSPACCGR